MTCPRIHCSWKEVKAFFTGVVITVFIVGVVTYPHMIANEKTKPQQFCLPVNVHKVVFNLSVDSQKNLTAGNTATPIVDNTNGLGNDPPAQGEYWDESETTIRNSDDIDEDTSSGSAEPPIQENDAFNLGNKTPLTESTTMEDQKSDQEDATTESTEDPTSTPQSTTTEHKPLPHSLPKSSSPSNSIKNSAVTQIYFFATVLTTVFIATGYYKTL